jgi:hypothetical protein
MRKSNMLTGGCFCGDIRYAVTGSPFHPTNCHCSICRRTTGAPFVAWFSVRTDEFQFTRGEPWRFRSSSTGMRAFCRRCGTQLTFVRDGLDEIDVTTASLDDPEAVPPTDNTQSGTRLSWIPRDGHPDYPASRAASS